MKLRTYDDGWWFRIGRFSLGRDDPEWHQWRTLWEREGRIKVWRWRGYSVRWETSERWAR